MYVPTHFSEDNLETLHSYIKNYNFGVLVFADEQGIEANHLPFVIHPEAAPSKGILQCHVAKNNLIWERLAKSKNVLVIFQGPNAYISPSWYPSKQESGKVVPTWNYLAVHVKGQVEIIHDFSWLKQHVSQLTYIHESTQDHPWSVEDAPQEFTENMINAIVGIEIKIEKITGKLKASQNQTNANRTAVKNQLAINENKLDNILSDLMD
jgi:transcriptional regulator